MQTEVDITAKFQTGVPELMHANKSDQFSELLECPQFQMISTGAVNSNSTSKNEIARSWDLNGNTHISNSCLLCLVNMKAIQ